MYFILLLLWIIFNGKITVEILLFGAVISLALYLFMWKFMDYGPKQEIKNLKRVFKALKYVGILVVEIFKANFQVIWLIYNQKIEAEPVLVHFKKSFKSHFSNEVLGNSITLTPGTITVKLDSDDYVVHCLDKDMAEGLDSSVFVRQLDDIEKVNIKKITKKARRQMK